MANTEFDLIQARILAKASAAAYADSVDAIGRDLSANSVETFIVGPMSGYVARLGENIILAFRGSISPLPEWESSIRQWIANLDFHQVSLPGGRVHRGFHQALDSVWKQAHRLIENQIC